MVEFIGTCVHLPAELLDQFDDSSVGISNRTFRKHIGNELYRELESNLGYGRWIRLHNDWHVDYAKGKWNGMAAVCCFWSGIHHIFTVS